MQERSGAVEPQAERRTFVVDPASSGLLIEARSSVGPIELGTTSLSGRVEVGLRAGGLAGAEAPQAFLELPVSSLTSGNSVYDAEVHRRLDARRFPRIHAELQAARELTRNRWSIEGSLTIHGTTRTLSGSADLALDGDRLRVLGEHAVDIRDFSISLPTTLMLRIYPDVMVRFQIEAVVVDRAEG